MTLASRIHVKFLLSLFLVLVGAFWVNAQDATATPIPSPTPVVIPVQQTFLLSNNTGDASTEWVIEGEKTLIMNGFDVSVLTAPKPYTVDAVSIAVTRGSGNPVGVIVYEDPNGGSPVDSRVIARTEVVLGATGVQRIALPTPAKTESSIIWIAFYLPVGFGFQADTSGASLLTYWAWTPGGEINTDNLDRAVVFGPSDGSAPVNLNINGIARITAELSGNVAITSGFTRESAPIGRQIVASEIPNLSLMQPYPYCSTLLFDPMDLGVSANGRFQLACRADILQNIPGALRNADDFTEGVKTFEKGGYVYDVFSGNVTNPDPNGYNQILNPPITHCVIPPPEHRERAVLAVAYGQPKAWDVLPTVRYGDYICAELDHQGLVTYLLPRTGEEQDWSVNLYFPSPPTTKAPTIGCDSLEEVIAAVRNEGFEATPPTSIKFRVTHVRTGEVFSDFEYSLPSVLAGETTNFSIRFISPNRFAQEAFRITLTLDYQLLVPERNEGDNTSSMTFNLVTTTRCK
jgi:hypothetical protein